MAAIESDVALAQTAAAQLLKLCQGRLRRVVMVGSRARGTPRPDSDLDLVCLLELGGGQKPWRPQDCAAEKRRLLHAVPGGRVKVDLWVRTTDQYAEARGVYGGAEWLIDNGGVAVVSLPFRRQPVVRRSPAQVRREHTATWVAHALTALEAASHASVRGPASPVVGQVASACVERAVTALLVYHEIRCPEPLAIGSMLGLLQQRDPALVAWLHQMRIDGAASTPQVTHALLAGITRWFGNDGAMRPLLTGIEDRLNRSMPFILC